MRALVRATSVRPRLEDGWDAAAWAHAETLEISHFRPEGGDHRPRTRVRLLHDGAGLAGIFRVEDRYVLSRHERFGDPVYEDSCVELFLQPLEGGGYFNFEINAGGTLRASHITDHRRVSGGFAAFTPLAEEDGRQVEIRSSLPRRVDPELVEPLTWQLAFFIPGSLLERYVGALGPLGGLTFRANAYKCGDLTSHPHWASWAPLDARNFHLPHCFGSLHFEG
jgi:hypothetical protein